MFGLTKKELMIVGSLFLLALGFIIYANVQSSKTLDPIKKRNYRMITTSSVIFMMLIIGFYYGRNLQVLA